MMVRFAREASFSRSLTSLTLQSSSTDLAADLVNGLGQPALLLGGKLVPGLAGGIDRDTLISVVKLHIVFLIIEEALVDDAQTVILAVIAAGLPGLPSARRRWTGWD